MKRNMLLRLAALPLALATVAVPAVSGCSSIGDAACPDFSASGGFGANLDIDANVKTFMIAAGNFQVLGREMVTEVGDACAKIALAAGGDESKWKDLKDADRVDAACTEAGARLDAVLAGAEIFVTIEGGQCRVSIEATASCNAECDVSGKCTPAQLEAHCEPGKLAGKCSGECKGTCSADAGSVQCAGTCDATCTGTCAGTCNGRCDGNSTKPGGESCAGTCDGACSAECTGTCSGQCKATAPSAQCSGTCHGECSVEYEAPYCEGEFTPPECKIDADCEANCEASATAQAECTPPKVSYEVTGAGGVDLSALAAVLQETLPVFVVNAVDRGEALVDSGTALVTSGEKIVNASGELALDAGACATVAAAAAVEAAANISVSVKFSVSVSASARGSASSQ